VETGPKHFNELELRRVLQEHNQAQIKFAREWDSLFVDDDEWNTVGTLGRTREAFNALLDNHNKVAAVLNVMKEAFDNG